MEQADTPPLMQEYSDPIEYAKARIAFRRSTESGFSVVRECRKLRRCSPALVTMILKKQRPLSAERIDDLGKIMGLRFRENLAFKNWVLQTQDAEFSNDHERAQAQKPPHKKMELRRREVSHHLLSDWLHPYVKDAFRFEHLQKNAEDVIRFLGNIASPQRIRKSLQFLIREGYLRRTLEGHIVEEVALTVSDSGISSKKVREFHKKALQFSMRALDLFPPDRRLANTLVLPLSKSSHAEVTALIEEFTHKLQLFAEKDDAHPEELFQLILNFSPVGINLEASHEKK